MKKSVTIGIIAGAIIGLVLLLIIFGKFIPTEKNDNRTLSKLSSGTDAKAQYFVGSCIDHMYLNGKEELYDCIEYWGLGIGEFAKCNPSSTYFRSEWSKERCSTDNALGACKLEPEKLPGNYIITFNYRPRADNTWCEEKLHGEFIPQNELGP